MTLGKGGVHSSPPAREISFRDASASLRLPDLARPLLLNTFPTATTSAWDSNFSLHVPDERFSVVRRALRSAKSDDLVPPNTAKKWSAFWAQILGRNMVPRARVPTVGTLARGPILRPRIRAQNADHESGPEYGNRREAAQRL